jgi:hypothetical protein
MSTPTPDTDDIDYSPKLPLSSSLLDPAHVQTSSSLNYALTHSSPQVSAPLYEMLLNHVIRYCVDRENERAQQQQQQTAAGTTTQEGEQRGGGEDDYLPVITEPALAQIESMGYSVGYR